LAGLTVSQISEFSIIIITLGVRVGHVTNEILSFMTVIALITIAGSSYLIIYANKIYPHISKYLTSFEKKGRKVDEHKYHEKENYDILLFGCSHIGHDLIESFRKINKSFLVIDHNPETVIKLAKSGIDCRYSDAGDHELLDELNLPQVGMVISTISDPEINLILIKKIRESNEKAIIIVVSHQIDEAMELYANGASYVLMPHFLGGHHTSTMIEENGLNFDKFLEEKISHINYLKHRKSGLFLYNICLS